MDKAMLVTIVSLLLVLVVTGMIAFMIGNGKSAQRKRMMNVIRGGTEDTGRKAAGKDVRRDAIARKLKQNGQDETEQKQTMAMTLVQAGLSISVAQYWMFSIAFAVAATLAVFLWGKGPFVICMTAIISLFGIPRFVVRHITKKRHKRFMEDLPDALEAMTRLLRAGMPVSEAIKMVAREYTGPVGDEMGRIFDQQKIGVSLPEAVQDCGRRVPLAEVQMFATAVTIQAQTGSSLSEILEGLAKVIRARFRLRRKVQALSSEAKASAAIIGALPLLVMGGMYFTNPKYISLLFTQETGNVMLGVAGFWMLVGVLIMKQMINFKV